MVFSSLLFLFGFLPVVLACYYLAPRRLRNLILFLASLVFYAWGEPVYVLLILFSTVVDYCAGRFVSYAMASGHRKRALCAVICSAVINLSLLGFFKYFGFALRIWNRITGMALVIPKIALPIGISFYTFQTMSYTIDVYRGDAKVQKDFISFGLYVALFPQLIAGPIIRYKTVAEQMKGRKESLGLFAEGVWRFVIGLGKKVMIANQVGRLFQEVAAQKAAELTLVSAWLGVVAFTLQIYFDFSGYSDMAIGLGKMFGFEFAENFDHPYESKSITEFWRRWHISLGTWFKEYVYIPLGGNRCGAGRQIFNIVVVWFLTGLWHGAYGNFILWGVYYGILLVLEKLVLKKGLEKLPGVLRHLYTMFFVMLGWAIFSWQDLQEAGAFFGALFGGTWRLYDRQSLYLMTSYGVLLLVAAIGSVSWVGRLLGSCMPEGTRRREGGKMVWMLLILLLSVALLVNSSYNPFLYFRF